MDAINLYDGEDVGDICVADIDGEVYESRDVNVELMCGICNESDSDSDSHAPEVSVVDSALFTDDDKRELPALYHQDQHVGNSESKHLEF